MQKYPSKEKKQSGPSKSSLTAPSSSPFRLWTSAAVHRPTKHSSWLLVMFGYAEALPFPLPMEMTNKVPEKHKKAP